MTQEEEDRLLDSSGEESQDSNLLIQMDLVETCQIGNARITLPKFMNSPLGEHQSNDLKRTKSTARLKTLECKKKKWDVSFKPEYPVTHVYLNDIGYVAADDGESNTESESESRLSEPPFSSLIVICSKDKVVCENAQGSRERCVESFKFYFLFKLNLIRDTFLFSLGHIYFFLSSSNEFSLTEVKRLSFTEKSFLSPKMRKLISNYRCRPRRGPQPDLREWCATAKCPVRIYRLNFPIKTSNLSRNHKPLPHPEIEIPPNPLQITITSSTNLTKSL